MRRRRRRYRSQEDTVEPEVKKAIENMTNDQKADVYVFRMHDKLEYGDIALEMWDILGCIWEKPKRWDVGEYICEVTAKSMGQDYMLPPWR